MGKQEDLFRLLQNADETGVRLEIVGGLPLWEFSQVQRHQSAVDNIRGSIKPRTKKATGCEAKDIEIGPRFYLSQGVKDVVVFDPHTLLVLHVRRDGVTRQISPVTIALECGCQCVV